MPFRPIRSKSESGQPAHHHSPLLNVRAAIERVLSPGYGCCACCRRPWRFAQPHLTPVISPDGREVIGGRFCLCEGCWGALRIYQRIAFYELRFGQQEGWPQILRAVREEAVTRIE